HLLRDRVGHTGADLLLADLRARDLLAVAPLLPDLAGADLVGLLAADGLLLLLAAALAVARVEAGLAAGDGALLGLAGLAVLLADPLAALLLHGLVGRDRLADRGPALLVAGLADLLVAGLAAVAVAGLADALLHAVAARAVAGLLHRPADGVA